MLNPFARTVTIVRPAHKDFFDAKQGQVYDRMLREKDGIQNYMHRTISIW